MKAFLSAAPKLILLLAGTWTLGFLLLLALGMPAAAMVPAMNIFEMAFGLLSGSFLLAASIRKAQTTARYVMLGTAMAVFSWTLGQVFWFSFTNITGEALPYPSVGDLGYTGAYFFLAGVLHLLQAERKARRPWYAWLSFLVLGLPAVLMILEKFSGAASAYNFVLALAIGFAFLRAVPMLGDRQYRLFTFGVFALGAADLIFIISVCLYPDSPLYLSDMMYSSALALISSGMLERGGSYG